MDCALVSERLPWLLNGSLDAAEVDLLKAHLQSCSSCLAELAETREAARVFDAHLPAGVLVDVAWERPAAGWDPDLIQRHLQHCTECAEALALVRESRQLEDRTDGSAESAVVPVRPATIPVRPQSVRPFSRRLGVAAGLAAAFAGGLLAGRAQWDGSTSSELTRVLARNAQIEAELRRQQGAATAADAELARLRAPLINQPVVELVDATTRDPDQPLQEVVLSAESLLVTLLLSGDGAANDSASVEIAGSGRSWTAEGLQRDRQAFFYKLTVPASFLPDGRYTITVRPRGGTRPLRYAFSVRRRQ